MIDLSGFHVIAGTGSRSLAIASYDHVDEIFNQVVDHLVEAKRTKNVMVMSGGAEGFDHLMTMAARAAKVPFVLVIPNKGYFSYYWIAHSVTGQNQSLDARDMIRDAACVEYVMEEIHNTTNLRHKGVHGNFWRNQRMVDLADEFLVYNPTSSGTHDCVTRINQANKPWKVVG